MVLETKRLLLREWDERDASELYPLARDPDIGPRCGWKPHESEAESREVIRRVLMAPETCAITLRETGQLIGSMGLHPVEGCPDDRELGYWIGKPFWGRGYTPEAAREMLRHAFEVLRCSQVWCEHFDFNAQSKRVIDKCGFRYCTTKETTLSDGVLHIALRYVLTRAEWEELS